MRSSAAALISLVALGAAVQAKLEVPWPEHGSIKLITPKSPPQINLELPGCLAITIDWRADRVEVTKGEDISPILIEGGERLREDGGQLVVLLTLEGGQAIIIVNAEDTNGAFDTRMRTIDIAQCPISRLRVSSSNKEQLTDVKVGVSQEIEKLYLESQGFIN